MTLVTYTPPSAALLSDWVVWFGEGLGGLHRRWLQQLVNLLLHFLTHTLK